MFNILGVFVAFFVVLVQPVQAEETYKVTTVVPFDAEWMFWYGHKEPANWPLSEMPKESKNAVELLQETLSDAAKKNLLVSGTAKSDTDRVLPLRVDADDNLALLTDGQWWSGFMAPYASLSEQQWKNSLSSRKKAQALRKRRKFPPFSRTSLVYPATKSRDAALQKYSSENPEPGPTNMYFVKEFEIEDVSALVSLHLDVQYKKGLRVYINGNEVALARIEPGASHGDFGFTKEHPDPWIRSTIRKSDRWEEVWSGINPNVLKNGKNVIAAVVYKAHNGGSPGMFFDAKLLGHTEFTWVKKPYLHRVTQDGVTVSWEATANSGGRVVIKDTAGNTVKEVESGTSGVLHHVQVRGLKPDTKYGFTVIGKTPEGVETSIDSTFTTSPSDSSDFVFMLYGDSRWGTHIHNPLAKLMAADSEKFGANLVVHTGDIVSEGYRWDLWQEKFFDPAEPLISRVPMYPVPGNHELKAELYYDYFDLPNNEAWYHFRYGIADFYGLNTNTRFDPNSQQYKWFVKELEKSKAPWKVVFMHHPPFSCAVVRKPGAKYVIRHLVPLFEKYGVDLVLLGHDHVYGRSTDVNGVHYLISGGGGSSLYKSAVDDKMTRCDRKYNYVRLHVDKKKIRWVAYDQKGVLIEEYAIGEDYTEGKLKAAAQ